MPDRNPTTRQWEFFFSSFFFMNQLLTVPWILNSTYGIYSILQGSYTSALFKMYFLHHHKLFKPYSPQEETILSSFLLFRHFETISSAIFRTIYINSKWSIAPKSGIREKYCTLLHTDKKENKRVQSHIWLTASSILICGEKFAQFLIYYRKPFYINDFAPDPIWISLYMRKILFSFLSMQVTSCWQIGRFI